MNRIVSIIGALGILAFTYLGCKPGRDLATVETIQGHVLPASSWVYEDPSTDLLKFVKLGADIHLQGIEFPRDSFLDFDAQGKILTASMGREFTIQGVKVGQGGQLCFYKTGQLREVMLIEPTVIQGISLGTGVFVYFRSNGKIHYFITPHDMVVGDTKIGFGHEVYLDVNGKVERVVPHLQQPKKSGEEKAKRRPGQICEPVAE